MQVLNDSRLMVGIPIWEPCPDVTIRFWRGTAQMILLDVTCAHTHILSFNGGCQVHHFICKSLMMCKCGFDEIVYWQEWPYWRISKASSCQSEVPLWNLQELRVNCSKKHVVGRTHIEQVALITICGTSPSYKISSMMLVGCIMFLNHFDGKTK